jgi:quinol monooxygenase YgiN
MTTIVILDIPATADTRDQVLATLQEALPTTRAFDGCEGLELLVNQDDRANIVVYERWASRGHYDAYRAFRAETGFSARFRAMFPQPPIVRVLDVDRAYP